MTEKEIALLKMFRNLDRYKQNIVIGKASELILSKKKEKVYCFEEIKIKYLPIVFVFIF